MFKSKKASLLISRPQPPSFAEVIEDINRADENDVVFEFSDSLAEEAAAAEDKGAARSTAEQNVNSVTTNDTRDDGKSSPDVDTVYQQAREFIRLMEELKTYPEKLQALYEHLKLQDANLQDSIRSLRQKAEELKAVGPDFSRVESELKS